MIKAVANSALVNTTPQELTDSRYQRFYNSNTTTVANVAIGANSSITEQTVIVGPGGSLTVDTGGNNKWVSIQGAADDVYRTPVSGGSA